MMASIGLRCPHPLTRTGLSLALGLACASTTLAAPAGEWIARAAGLAPALLGTAAGAPAALALDSLVRVVDDVGSTIEVVLPEGAARLVLEPAPETSDDVAGWLAIYDQAGRLIEKRPESVGLAVHLREQGTLLRRLADLRAGPVEVLVPTGGSVVRLISQNYDRDANPRRDGRVLVFDTAGRLVAEEDGLALDLLTP